MKRERRSHSKGKKNVSIFSFLIIQFDLIGILERKLSSTHSQLNEIEDALTNLESTIMKLDAYSRSLESQVKTLEKTTSVS